MGKMVGLLSKEAPVIEAAKEQDKKKSLSKMTKDELLEVASKKGIEVPDSATNEEIIALIKDKK